MKYWRPVSTVLLRNLANGLSPGGLGSATADVVKDLAVSPRLLWEELPDSPYIKLRDAGRSKVFLLDCTIHTACSRECIMSSSIGNEDTIRKSARLPYFTKRAFAKSNFTPLQKLLNGFFMVYKCISRQDEALLVFSLAGGGTGGRPPPVLFYQPHDALLGKSLKQLSN